MSKLLSFFNFCFLERDASLLPCRKTVSVQALDEVYICVKNSLKDFLQKTPKDACITMDGWSDEFRHISYFTFTYHCLYNWELKSIVLKTCQFSKQHTMENIRDIFNEMIAEFNLEDKQICLVTDIAINMRAAARLLELERYPCLAHATQRLLMHDMYKHRAMRPLRRVIKKMKSIQTALLYSHHKLKQISDELFQNKLADALTKISEIGKFNFTIFDIL